MHSSGWYLHLARTEATSADITDQMIDDVNATIIDDQCVRFQNKYGRSIHIDRLFLDMNRGRTACGALKNVLGIRGKEVLRFIEEFTKRQRGFSESEPKDMVTLEDLSEIVLLHPIKNVTKEEVQQKQFWLEVPFAMWHSIAHGGLSYYAARGYGPRNNGSIETEALELRGRLEHEWRTVRGLKDQLVGFVSVEEGDFRRKCFDFDKIDEIRDAAGYIVESVFARLKISTAKKSDSNGTSYLTLEKMIVGFVELWKDTAFWDATVGDDPRTLEMYVLGFNYIFIAAYRNLFTYRGAMYEQKRQKVIE